MFDIIDPQQTNYLSTYDVLFGPADKCFACHRNSVAAIQVDNDVVPACDRHISLMQLQMLDAEIDLI